MNTLATIAWAIMSAVVVWGLMLVRAAATRARLNAKWRNEVQHWQAEATRAREYAAQLARGAATSTAGYQPSYGQGREYVAMNAPLLIATPFQLTEPRRAVTDMTDLT
jgi:hypothetical protein